MCYHTLLDHTIYMDAQMQNKCFVSTSQVIYNAICRIYPVTFLISEEQIQYEKSMLQVSFLSNSHENTGQQIRKYRRNCHSKCHFFRWSVSHRCHHSLELKWLKMQLCYGRWVMSSAFSLHFINEWHKKAQCINRGMHFVCVYGAAFAYIGYNCFFSAQLLFCQQPCLSGIYFSAPISQCIWNRGRQLALPGSAYFSTGAKVVQQWLENSKHHRALLNFVCISCTTLTNWLQADVVT